eukprot:121668_1
MDLIFQAHPRESVTFFSRCVRREALWSVAMMIPTVRILQLTWASAGWVDIKLRWWIILRIFMFGMQIPMRYELHKQFQFAEGEVDGLGIAHRLLTLLDSTLWHRYSKFSLGVVSWFMISLGVSSGFMWYSLESQIAPLLLYLSLVQLSMTLVHIALTCWWVHHMIRPDLQERLGRRLFGPKLYVQSDIDEHTSSLFFDSESSPRILKFQSETCTVCLCDYSDNDQLRILKCDHHYHVMCVDEWLKARHTCPLCHRKFFDKIR